MTFPSQPLHNAVVWLDTRTAALCEQMTSDLGKDHFRSITGLPISTYFSAFKLRWLLDEVEQVRAAVAECVTTCTHADLIDFISIFFLLMKGPESVLCRHMHSIRAGLEISRSTFFAPDPLFSLDSLQRRRPLRHRRHVADLQPHGRGHGGRGARDRRDERRPHLPHGPGDRALVASTTATVRGDGADDAAHRVLRRGAVQYRILHPKGVCVILCVSPKTNVQIYVIKG